MARRPARYDDFAEWYEMWIGDGPALIADHADLLPPLAGTRVLDVACGLGRMSRHLADSGAEVVGVDISAALLEKARANDPTGIDYVHADVTQPPEWWDGRPFDGCTCELALMDIDDLAGTLAMVAAVLRPRGGGYDKEGWWSSPNHNPDGARIRVGATHRQLSTYLNGLLDAGLEIERIIEPAAAIPTFLLWRCRRR